MNNRVPSAEELIGLDSFDFSFLILTGHARLIEPFDAYVKLLSKAYKGLRKTELWGPEVELAKAVYRRGLRKHVQPGLDALQATIDYSGEISINTVHAHLAIEQIHQGWKAMLAETTPAIREIILTTISQADNFFEKQKTQAAKATAEEVIANTRALVERASMDNIAWYSNRYGEDLVGEAQRLVGIVQTNPRLRTLDKLDLQRRLELLGPPPVYRLDTLSDVQVGKIWNWTGLEKARSENVKAYTIVAELDGSTCSVCQHTHGKEYMLSDALAKWDGESGEATRSLDSSRDRPIALNPFPTIHDVDNKPRSEFVHSGLYPPFHPNCRCTLVPLWSGAPVSTPRRDPKLGDIETMDEARMVAEREGIIISPNRITKALPTLDELKAAFKVMDEIPPDMRIWARERGLKMEFLSGKGVTEADSCAHLAGSHPPGWPEGTTWDIVGGCGPARGEYLSTVCINPRPTYHKSVRETILHEWAHGFDRLALEGKDVSTTNTWVEHWGRLLRVKDMPEPHNYFISPETGALELFADEFEAWRSGRLMDADIRDYFGQLEHAVKTKGADWVHDPLIEVPHWRRIGEQLGSNPGGQYLSPDGKKYYVKFYQNPDQAASEALANGISRSLMLEAPENIEGFVTIDGQKGLATRWMDRVKTINEYRPTLSSLPEAEMDDIAKQYLNAVLTSNWDFVGGAYDNLARLPNGRWVCLDSGGAFRFRARGGVKDYIKSSIDEFDSLIDSGHSGVILKDIISKTIDQDPLKYTQWMSELTDMRIHRRIENIVANWERAGSEFVRGDLEGTIIARRDLIIKRLKDMADDRVAQVVSDIPAMQTGLTTLQQKYLESFKSLALTSDKVTDIQSSLRSLYGIEATKEEILMASKMAFQDMELRIAVPLDEYNGDSLFNSLKAEGRLKNQFELGRHATSQGALDPRKGGSRDAWEEELGKGIYQKDPRYRRLRDMDYFPPELGRERPNYGYVADNASGASHYSSVNGASEQYGRVNFVLSDEVKARTSFSIGNSSAIYNNRDSLAGTLENNYNLLARFFADNNEETIRKFLSGNYRFTGFTGGYTYVEAQIIGGVDLRKPGEVRKIIILLRATETENVGWAEYAKNLGKQYNIPVEFQYVEEWNPLPTTKPSPAKKTKRTVLTKKY